MPSAFCRRRFLRGSLGGVVALGGCYVERKRLPTATGSASATDVREITLPAGVDPILFRAAEDLWHKQAFDDVGERVYVPQPGVSAPSAADGGWHSTTYAQLRAGLSLTPLVLWALHAATFPLASCPWIWPAGEHFLREHVRASGVLAGDDPDLAEYPNYGTALALRCLVRAQTPGDRSIVARMTKYLVDQQYCEANGFGPEHVAYGGWGYGGRLPVGGSPGHMDLAHTRHVLEALGAAGHDDAETYRRAERFLRLVQKHPTEDREQPSLKYGTKPHAAKSKPAYDGGFYFSPVVLAANKAGEAEHEGRPYFRSYATATCEGVLALLACGVKKDDERVRAAVGRLEKHPRLDYPEGIPEDQHENWGASIRYYHFAVRAQCYAALDWPGDWRGELRAEIARRQLDDGSFVNREGILMKEDDPILCTALAVLALGYAK